MGDQLSDIRQFVLDRMSASSVDPAYDPAMLDRTINATNKRLGREFDWPWLQAIGTISFAINVATYTLTSTTNYRHTKHLGLDNKKLRYRSPSEFIGYDALTGQYPSFYTIVNNTLTIAPIPTAAVVLDHVYVIDENDLTDDGSTCLLPAAYTELLVLKVCVALSQRSKDQARVNMFKSEFRDAIVEARDEVRRTRDLPRITADDSIWRTL